MITNYGRKNIIAFASLIFSSPRCYIKQMASLTLCAQKFPRLLW